MEDQGSFRKAALERDEEAFLSEGRTEFFAYECIRIEEEVNQVERRRVTQFVEHGLHIKVICSGILASGALELISDTKFSAPMGVNYPWAQQVIDEIYNAFLRDFADGWRSQ